MMSLTQIVVGYSLIMAVIAFILILMKIFGPKPAEEDILQRSLKEFIIRLLIENQQLRELLRAREPEWENEG